MNVSHFLQTSRNRLDAFSLVEVLAVITIMGILTAISVPSFQGWLNRETYNRQISLVFDSLNTARAGMLSEKNCPSGTPAEYWSVVLTIAEISVVCKPIDNPVVEVVTYNDQDTNDYFFDSAINSPSYWLDSGSGLPVAANAVSLSFQFLLSTKQVRINNDFANESAKIDFLYVPDGVTNTSICLNRRSQFPFYSPSFNCSEL